MERHLLRVRPLVREQHQHARGRLAPLRLPRRADAHAERVRARLGRAQGEGREPLGEDMVEGLAAIISVKLREPQFEGQTKTKLGNPSIKGVVETAMNSMLARRSSRSTRTTRRRSPEGGRGRPRPPGRAQGARPDAPQDARSTRPRCPGKLADCSITDPAQCELYLVEGNSAGGSAVDAPQPRVPGDPAAARQDHQRREGAHRRRCSRTRRSRASSLAIGATSARTSTSTRRATTRSSR